MSKYIFVLMLSAISVFTLGWSPPAYGAKSSKMQEQWKTFTSKKGGFEIDLPATPDHIEQKVDIPNTNLSLRYDTFVSEPSESVVYVVSVWKYPEEIDMSTPEVNLQDGFNGMLSALPNAQVLKMEMTKVQGFDALSFKVQSEDIYFQGELILVHNTLYQVFSVYKEGEDMHDDMKQFLSSFKLINPEQHKTELPALQKSSRRMNV